MSRVVRAGVVPASIAIAVMLMAVPAAQGPRPRARDLGVPFQGTPAALNAITDVAGVDVGHATIVVRRGGARRWARGRCAPA